MLLLEVSNGFLFGECSYKRKKFRLRALVGHGYVSPNITQHNLFWGVCHLLPETSVSIPTKVCRVCLKKILKEFSEFCSIVVYFIICYSCCEVSLLQPIFSIICIPTFLYKKMRKWYFLTYFEVDELLPLPLSCGIRFTWKYLWWIGGSQGIIDLLFEEP